MRLIDDYGPEIVSDAVNQLSAEQQADVIRLTAHNAKGRERPSVTAIRTSGATTSTSAAHTPAR